MRRHVGIFLILLLYLSVGALYAIHTPDWQAPDEPAHYNYVRQLAAGRWPVMEPGDYDQNYQGEVIGQRFAAGYDLTRAFAYEDYQPPLYYLLLTPIFWLTNGQLEALRLVSLLLGGGVVALTYAIGLRLRPSAPWLALSAAAFVAFLPQHIAMLSAVNNDSLAELLIAAIWWQLVSLFIPQPDPARFTHRAQWLLGGLLGAAFLTKVTAYLMAPIVALALWRLYRTQRAGLRPALGRVIGLALLLGSVWWLRNLWVYPGLDPLGIHAHDSVVVGQPTTAAWVARQGWENVLAALGRTTFQSFWGQFGWMAAPLPPRFYLALALFTLLTGLGLLLAFWRSAADWRREPGRSLGLLFGTLVLLNLGLFLGYNITYVQHQGRYLFPSLIPISLGVALAWATLLRPLAHIRPAFLYSLPLGLGLGLSGLALLALFNTIVPFLAPP